MKGLYIKDLKLMKNQKSFFLIVGLMAIFFAMTQENNFFVISYATFISSMFVISSISYDEFNNGNSFLFTLPINKILYVKEKYLLGITLSSGVWLITTLLIGILNYIKGTEFIINEWLIASFAILLIVEVMISIIIPVQLKFGQNKGNIAMLLTLGVIVAIIYVLIKILYLLGIDIFAIINMFSSIMLVVIGVIVTLSVVSGSYLISCKIMYKKEF